MIQNEKLWDTLYSAAESVYKYFVKDLGFYAGTAKSEEGKVIKLYNRYPVASSYITHKLGRDLTIEEQVILAIAVGDKRQKCLKKLLSVEEIDTIFNDLWNGKPNVQHACIPFDRLVTNI